MLTNRIMCFGKKKRQELSLVEMQDYLINWEAGALGLTFRPELGMELPPVVFQVLPEKSIARFSGVQVGDLLVSINGKKTSFLGYDRSMRKLYRGKLPIVLHFRTPLKNQYMHTNMANTAQYAVDDRTCISRTSFSRGGPLPMLEEHGHALELATHEHPLDPQYREYTEFSHLNGPHARARTDSQITTRLRVASRQHPTRAYRHPSPKRAQSSRDTSRIGIAHHDVKKRKKREPYKVIWEKGNLGISFSVFKENLPLPMVDFIVDEDFNDQLGRRGIGVGMKGIQVGDVLVGINAYKTKDLSFDQSLRMLNTLKLPVILRFISTKKRLEKEEIGNDPLQWEENAEFDDEEVDIWRHQTENDGEKSNKREKKRHTDALGRGTSRAERIHSNVFGELEKDQEENEKPTLQAERKHESTMRKDSGMDFERARINATPENSDITANAPLSLAASMMLVAGTSNLALDQMVFAGVPLLSICENTKEARLLHVYARACLASKHKSTLPNPEKSETVQVHSPVSEGSRSQKSCNDVEVPNVERSDAFQCKDTLSMSALGPSHMPQASGNISRATEALYSSKNNELEALMKSNSNVAMFALPNSPCASSMDNQVIKIRNTDSRHYGTHTVSSSGFIPLTEYNTTEATRKLSCMYDRESISSDEVALTASALQFNVCPESDDIAQHAMEANALAENNSSDALHSQHKVFCSTLSAQRPDWPRLVGGISDLLQGKPEKTITQKAQTMNEIIHIVESLQLDQEDLVSKRYSSSTKDEHLCDRKEEELSWCIHCGRIVTVFSSQVSRQKECCDACDRLYREERKDTHDKEERELCKERNRLHASANCLEGFEQLNDGRKEMLGSKSSLSLYRERNGVYDRRNERDTKTYHMQSSAYQKFL